ncbi:hypothetical protein [Stenotrophomonas maltophilia]|uniref:hypothetical protein n=1 Tax=Stenotrophomonas maltophilia TaxID=40324 RepID=UPI003B9DE0FB
MKALRQRSISINYRWSIHRAIPIALGARIFSMGPVWRRTEHRRSATSSAHIFLFRDTPRAWRGIMTSMEAAHSERYSAVNKAQFFIVQDPSTSIALRTQVELPWVI